MTTYFAHHFGITQIYFCKALGFSGKPVKTIAPNQRHLWFFARMVGMGGRDVCKYRNNLVAKVSTKKTNSLMLRYLVDHLPRWWTASRFTTPSARTLVVLVLLLLSLELFFLRYVDSPFNWGGETANETSFACPFTSFIVVICTNKKSCQNALRQLNKKIRENVVNMNAARFGSGGSFRGGNAGRSKNAYDRVKNPSLKITYPHDKNIKFSRIFRANKWTTDALYNNTPEICCSKGGAM